MARSRKRKSHTLEQSFLEALRSSGSVVAASRWSKVPRRTAYSWRKLYVDFAQAWDDAIEEALDIIEARAMDAAVNPKKDPIEAGRMQRWILSKRRPKVWGDKLIHQDPDGNAVPLTQEVNLVIKNAITDPVSRELLDSLAKRMESDSSSDSSEAE